jgi:hypothetical protein
MNPTEQVADHLCEGCGENPAPDDALCSECSIWAMNLLHDLTKGWI